MKMNHWLMSAAAIIFTSLLLASCVAAPVRHPATAKRGYGPPPHAPAHGHRYKHPHGVDLVYDSALDLYVVIGFTDYYFYDNYYYRLLGDLWELSVIMDGPWGPVPARALPPGLLKKSKGKAKPKKHSGHGWGQHKKGW